MDHRPAIAIFAESLAGLRWGAMFVDGRGISTGEELEADVVIVGGGAAGITLALALDAAELRVLIVESGDRGLQTETQLLYRGGNVGLPYFDLVSARLRYFGGSTNHWSGTCRPFGAFDLAAHEWIPRSGWPIGAQQLEPYYPRAGEICGLPSSTWDSSAWVEQSPYPALDVDPDRIETRVAQTVRGTRRRLALTYDDDVEDSTSVTVVLNSNLVEIEVGDDAEAVSGLRLRTLTGVEFRARARAYVLAAGGIENPRLLLASTARFPAGVGNGHDLVGRHFLEHPRFVGAVLASFDPTLDVRFYLAHDAGGSRITGYLAIPEAVREAEALSDVQFRLEPRFPEFYERAIASEDVVALRRLAGRTADNSDPLGDLSRVVDDVTSWRRFVALGGPLPVPLPEAASAAVGDAERRAALIPEVFGDIATLIYGESIGRIPIDAVDVVTRIDPIPNPNSRVRLGSDRDELGVPMVELDWQLSAHDRDSVIQATELLGAELGRAGIGRLRGTLDDGATDWPADLAGGWHHMGTTRMHDDPAHGVVDRDCRVHGLRNLYVAGSSVFTTAGSATPTLTIVALALRLADHLQEAVAS
jgi:choline dehydrogenase-like flavoprotein